MKHILLAALAVVGLAAGLASGSAASAYPDKPLRLVVPFPPGATTDTSGRLIAQYLERGLGQPVVVDNRSGAGGSVGVGDALKSPADGYTLLVVTSGQPLLSFSYKLAFDPVKDMQALSMVLNSPLVLVVNPSVPARDVRELISYAAANPGRLNFATTGTGEPLFIFEMLKNEGHVNMVHVPYKGGTEALNGVLRGDSQMQFTNVFQARQFEHEGKLRIIGVSTRQHTRSMPEVPTLAESGFPNAIGNNYVGMGAPRGTPAEVVARLYREIAAMAKMPEFTAIAEKLGFDAVGSTPVEFRDLMEAQVNTWAPYARSLGIKPD